MYDNIMRVTRRSCPSGALFLKQNIGPFDGTSIPSGFNFGVSKTPKCMKFHPVYRMNSEISKLMEPSKQAGKGGDGWGILHTRMNIDLGPCPRSRSQSPKRWLMDVDGSPGVPPLNQMVIIW